MYANIPFCLPSSPQNMASDSGATPLAINISDFFKP